MKGKLLRALAYLIATAMAGSGTLHFFLTGTQMLTWFLYALSGVMLYMLYLTAPLPDNAEDDEEATP